MEVGIPSRRGHMDEKPVMLEERRFMQLSDFREGFFSRMADSKLWEMLSDRFDVFLAGSAVSPKCVIPKILHQIWIGSNLPEAYRGWTRSWQRLNKNWEYRFWNEKAIQGLGLKNDRAFRISPSYGVKSDIARYEILERFGGVYADTDFECLKPFDDISERCSFFAGIIFGDAPVINNGLMGSTPGHILLKKAIAGLASPVMTKDGMKVLNRSGPGYFTNVFFQAWENLDEHDVIFPSTYFYPWPNFKKSENTLLQEAKGHVREWSYAIHYWEASWLKPSALRRFLGRMKKTLLAIAFRSGTRKG
jgi:mannosyltransferase OCH1-like enzyme